MTQDRFVSCLMVTKPSVDRLPFAKRSIAAYLEQSHGPKELVIVVEAREGRAVAPLADHIASLGRPDIRLACMPGDPSLGALRNHAVRQARGDALCQWDDDDLHHPERIATQLASMRMAGCRSCCLQDVFQYVVAERALYWTNWQMTPAQVHPGTLLCERDAGLLYPEEGPDAVVGEDTAALAALRRSGPVHALPGAPHLFVYVTHGGNVWAAGHHRMLIETLSISSGLLRRREAQVRAGLSAFALPPGVTVMGSNGPAFSLNGSLRDVAP